MMKETNPEEDFLMSMCDRFMESLTDEGSEHQRNSYFRIIWHITKQRVQADIEAKRETPYPLLSDYVPKHQWKVAPTVTSDQQKNFVCKVQEVLELKCNGNVKGDTFV